MRQLETTLTQKGQVTIPSEIRSRLGLKPHDKVVFEVEGDTAKLRRAESKILKWYGSVAPTEKPEDFRRVRDEFEEGVAEEVAGDG
ncbi:MAG: AbrB/MazE/SpoVT family DNA-binding domain-containing protein [Dehalococcoidia bacterium]|nr:AbrB/MazE/SpoVT family DNA-binding domain-containing protein [Dehalococcoidia bacterium]